MKTRNLNLFYIHEFFFQFTNSILLIVLPVFFYDLYDSLVPIFLFGLTINIIHGLLFIPILNVAMKLRKPTYAMVVGIILFVLSLWMFSKAEPGNTKMIIPATIAFGLYIAFYWMIRHWVFSSNSDYKKMGKQVSWLGIISIVVSFIGPIVAGIVGKFVSFNATFIIGAVSGAASLVPVFLLTTNNHPGHISLKKLKDILKKTEIKSQRLTFFLEGCYNNFVNAPWILAFTIFIGSFLDLGLLVGITALVTMILVHITGNLFDQKHRKKLILKLTNLRTLSSLLYVSIYFFPSLIYVYSIQLANRFIGAMHDTGTDSYLFAYSNKINPIYFVLNREIYLTISRILSSSVLAIAFTFLPAEFLWVSIAIGAFCILGWKRIIHTDHLLH